MHEHNHPSTTNTMAASATLHCLTGCAIGEISGLIIGTGLGLGTALTVAISVSLAFIFGFTLSMLPVVKSGAGIFTALGLVAAADTLSIATMELVDNLVMAVIPGALHAGLSNPIFWVAMLIALTAAFLAAYPVNKHLLARGKGHALTHQYHHEHSHVTGWRRYIPSISSSTLAIGIAAFILGGLLVAVAA